MKKFTEKKLLIPAIILTLASGCADLQKTQGLLDAEKAYARAAEDKSVAKYASSDLGVANATLMRAGIAECETEMTSLAYIGNVQVETAIKKAEAQQAMQNTKNLIEKKEELVAASVLAKKESAQNQLGAMQERTAENEIILAFGKVEFVTGKVDLVPGVVGGVDLLADYLNANKTKKVTLSGHTDSTGSAERNKELSQQRADFIRDVLVSKGVAASRISSIGYGQSQPIASNSTREGRQKNRRIAIEFGR